ncbi:protein kinase domain-containing protein [Sorangium sp. So ce233]|uniref:protein kinase domain-containing protein n=1 Tax=Sorangium sp. So ce233 TaxID=3133290 RepID=UPI003F64299D
MIAVVSCSQDAPWRDRLVSHLRVHEGSFSVWDETQIVAGDERQAAWCRAITESKIAILVVSADFLASEFADRQFVEAMLRRKTANRLRIIPLLAKPCNWKSIEWLKPLEARPADGSFLTLLSPAEGERTLAALVSELHLLLNSASGTRRGIQPMYPNEAVRFLSSQLMTEELRRRALKDAGQQTSDVDARILALKRQLREGGQIQPGDTLNGRYLLLQKLGRGGFATVWKAEDQDSGGHVAIKVLHPELAGDTIRRDRFFRGARVMSELKHDAIVKVFESHSEDGGYHYFVMELIDGGDLHHVVLERPPTLSQAVSIILTIGDALAFAHERGFIHRDVKPANVLLTDALEPRLTDFDLVGGMNTTGGTRTGAMGTFVYAAPEVMTRPQEADNRSDVYGLGMTALFVLWGRELPIDVVRSTSDTIDALSCGRLIKEVLKRATDWNTKRRFSDAAAFCDALRRAVEASGASPRRKNTRVPSRRSTSKASTSSTGFKKRYAVPEPTRRNLLRSMAQFDIQLRGTPKWAQWETNPHHKYAVEHEGRRYPVKQILSMASGMPTSSFSGGVEANRSIVNQGFKVVCLHGTPSGDDG